MTNVYFIEGDNPSVLKKQLIDAVGSDKQLDISIRSLGESGIKLAHLSIDALHIIPDEALAQLVTDDERSFPVKYVAVGKAAIAGSIERSATLTVHEHETDVSPAAELEVLEDSDLG